MTEKIGFEKYRTIHRKYGNVPVHAEISGKEYNFRSKLEYRWAQHLEFCRQAGLIKDWAYEFCTFHFQKACVKEYTPDFVVQYHNGTREYHETKGMVGKFDIDKLKAVFDEFPADRVILIFWRKPKLSTQKRTKLERYCYEIIWDAAKRISKEPIDMS